MEYNIEIEGEIVVINLSGNFVRNVGEELKVKVSELTDKGFRCLLVDMSNVHLIDSYGITVCIALYKMMENKGGRLLYAKPSQAVEKVFHITHADQKFHVINNKDEGIRSIREEIRKKVEVK